MLVSDLPKVIAILKKEYARFQTPAVTEVAAPWQIGDPEQCPGVFDFGESMPDFDAATDHRQGSELEQNKIHPNGQGHRSHK